MSGESRSLVHLVALLSVGLISATVALAMLNGLSLHALLTDFVVVLVVNGSATGAVGWIIGSRRPANRVGQLLLAIGVVASLAAFTGQYARYALLTAPGSLPAGTFIAWLNLWIWVPAFAMFGAFLPLLFPDGRLPTSRWRWVGWLAGSAASAIMIFRALSTGADPSLEEVPNPYAVESWTPILEPIGAVGFVALALAMAGAVVSLLVRFRRTDSVQHLQIKWVLYAAALFLILEFSVPSIAANLGVDESAAAAVAELIGFPWVPIAMGLAILRYRLYDIDRLVSRTFSWALITALLITTYIAAVFLLRQVLPVEGELAVAASTLTVAALFSPLRRRVQALVDRRFNRSRYDAQRTVEEFGGRLREETGLETLGADLATVAARTMQPVSVSVWLREEAS